MIIVGKDEKVSTIAEALKLVSNENYQIYIKKGIYQEKLVIDKYCELIGEDVDETIITYRDYAKKLDESGKRLETFRSFTMLILANDVKINNLTIRNDAGIGETVGQAVALFANADNIRVANCKITGHQDTLLTGPIPFDAKNQENLNFKINHLAVYRQYYHNCLIQGDVDFIFGSANAFFLDSTIVSNDLKKDINGYISAPSTEEGNTGHVFYRCKLISEAKKESVYLGRPWRKFGQAIFIDCYMGAHIDPKGMAEWDDKHLTARFCEIGSYGEGAYRENSLVKTLDEHCRKFYLSNFKNI